MEKLENILMKWSLENKEYYMSYILYTEFNVGIPNKLLYNLPDKKLFTSMGDFLSTHNTKNSSDKYLSLLYKLFKESKYTSLPNWRGSYGYKYIS